MLAIDGVGFDWSDMVEEQVQTNMTLIAFSDSENEVLFSKEVAVLKREVACKDYEINVLKSEFEKVKQEKEGIEFKIEKFDKASKDLDKLLGSQITEKSKKGVGYNVVPPPHPLIYNRSKKLDLSYSGLDEFKEPEFKAYGSEDKYPKMYNRITNPMGNQRIGYSHNRMKDMTVVYSGCCKGTWMCNIAYLSYLKEFDRGFVKESLILFKDGSRTVQNIRQAGFLLKTITSGRHMDGLQQVHVPQARVVPAVVLVVPAESVLRFFC
ncbi:hypothetical protein Tco_0296690 [Tanacetum coccineum]